jgi:predicted HTH domain antitoxin
MSQITIDVPDVAIGADGDSLNLTADVKMAAAVRFYMTGRLSLYQAAQMVGITKIEFRQRMGEYGGSEFTQTHEELKQELVGV